MFRSHWIIIREHVDPSKSYHWSVVTLARIDVLPDDGPVGPKHVGVLVLMF